MKELELKQLRPRFHGYTVTFDVLGNIRFELKAQPRGPKILYAILGMRNEKYKSFAELTVYLHKDCRGIALAHHAAYGTYNVLKKALRAEGYAKEALTDTFLKNQMEEELEHDAVRLLYVLEAFMNDTLYHRQSLHQYLCQKNAHVFKLDPASIEARYHKEQSEAAETAHAEETAEPDAVTNVVRDRIVADITGRLKLVELQGHAELDLAHCILASAKAFNESYDNDAADVETQRVKAINVQRQAASETELPMSALAWANYSQFQRLTIHEATKAVTPSTLVQPVYLLLQYTWNDALDWAEEIRKAYEA